jgi:hypothetical protein
VLVVILIGVAVACIPQDRVEPAPTAFAAGVARVKGDRAVGAPNELSLFHVGATREYYLCDPLIVRGVSE